MAKLVYLTAAAGCPLMKQEKDALSTVSNRPLALMRWMNESITSHNEAGGFRCPPPILSRTYANLDMSVVAYITAWKVARCAPPPAVPRHLIAVLRCRF